MHILIELIIGLAILSMIQGDVAATLRFLFRIEPETMSVRAALDGLEFGFFSIGVELSGTGATTLEAMTQALNHRGIRSPRGGRWHVSSVANLLARAQKIEAVATTVS